MNNLIKMDELKIGSTFSFIKNGKRLPKKHKVKNIGFRQFFNKDSNHIVIIETEDGDRVWGDCNEQVSVRG